MSTIPDPDVVQGVTRTSQIIVGAMTVGVAFFLALIFLLGLKPEAGKNPAGVLIGVPPLTLAAIALAATGLAASAFVPAFSVKDGLRRLATGGPGKIVGPDEAGGKAVAPGWSTSALMQLYQTQLIIASALTEGAAFFGALAYMLEGHVVALGLASFLVIVLASRFPTPERVRGWLENAEVRLQEARRGEF